MSEVLQSPPQHVGGSDGGAAAWAPSPAPRTSVTQAPPLRIGILVDELVQPAWIERVLRETLGAGVGIVAAVIVNAGDAAGGGSGEAAPREAGGSGVLARLRRYWRNRAHLPFAAATRLDQRRYARREGSPHALVDVSPLVDGAEIVRVTPRMTKFCDYVADADIARIAALDLDVMLRFGFRILKGGILGAARQGVWSFHHADNRVNRGGPAGFWEVMLGEPVTGATLQRLTEELDGGVVLGRTASSTSPISVSANRDNYYWQAAALLTARLTHLHRHGEVTPESSGWTAYDRRLYVAPTPREVATLSARVLFRLLRRRLAASFFREQWFIAYRLAPASGARADVPDGVMYRYRELRPPRDRFWADPFPAEHEGRHWIFYEEALDGVPNAHINVVEVRADGTVGEHATVLKRDYHLSYPSVFRWNGDWWMVPETLAIGKVQLFRATHFPHRWEHVADLLEGVPATDPTLLEHGGAWWMFVGAVVPGASEATALHLYRAPSPLGPWTPHARNPLKIDVRSARPAGHCFVHEGVLHRPAQDGSPVYGTAIVVHRVERLDAQEYSEVPVARIEAAWRPRLVGTHTLNAAGRLSVIDARERRPALFGRYL